MVFLGAAYPNEKTQAFLRTFYKNADICRIEQKPTAMEKIGIFCSACSDIRPVYFERARELGEWMGREHKTLVYGGADLGLMECVAQAVKQNGGHVIGIVPAKLEERGHVSDCIDTVFHTRDLSDRKDLLAAQSDVLVALPGGIGTLDEVFHVMAASTIGYYQKKIIFYNIDGFYDGLLDCLRALESQGFVRHPLDRYFDVVRDLNELITLLT